MAVVGMVYKINLNKKDMKNRLTTGWNFIRIVFTALGLFMLIQSLMDNEYLSSFLGGYLAVMGLFGVGCASGSCYSSGNCSSRNKSEFNADKKVVYQEIK